MNPSLRRFAQRLVAYEALGGNPLEARVCAAGRPAVLFAVYEKLRELLATLMRQSVCARPKNTRPHRKLNLSSNGRSESQG